MKKLMMVAAAALCCAAFAQAPEGGPRGGEGRRGGFGGPGDIGPGGAGVQVDPVVRLVSSPRAAEVLGLSQEQQDKLRALNNFGAARESQRKVREATQKQAELLAAEKVDEGAVMKAIDELFELRKEMAKEQTKRAIAIKGILTPEQIEKARKEAENFNVGGRGGQGRGGEGLGARGQGPRGEGAGPRGEGAGPRRGAGEGGQGRGGRGGQGRGGQGRGPRQGE